MKTHFFYLAAILCMVIQSRAQDLMFSNINQSLVYLNPSFAGSNGGIRLQTTYRNQWPNVAARMVSYNSCFDAYIQKLNGGLAVSATMDDLSLGTLKTTGLNLAYAQHIALADKKLKISPSIQFGFMQKKLDVASLNFGDPIDARYGVIWSNRNLIPEGQKMSFDLSTGLLVNYNGFYGGVAVKHINRPDIGLMGKKRIFPMTNVHASWNKKLNDKTLIQFFTLYANQENYNMVQLNANAVVYKNFILGAGCRSTKEGLFNLGFRDHFGSFMLSYDQVFSPLVSRIGHSVWSVAFSFTPKDSEDRKDLTDVEAW